MGWHVLATRGWLASPHSPDAFQPLEKPPFSFPIIGKPARLCYNAAAFYEAIMNKNELLQTITELSHEFGTTEYVRGGGGNTSCKTADTLWVKPSGTTLAGLQPETFVAMDRTALQKLYALAIPTESAAREAQVKDVMAAAVKPGQNARPSVEAPLHDVLHGTFVVHVHPAEVNGLTCARGGKAACAKLFPDALWIPYIDPGYTLCMDVRRRVLDYTAANGKPPSLLILENHGIFVTADTPAEIRAIYRRVMDELRSEYAAAGITAVLPVAPPALPDVVARVANELRDALSSHATGIAYSGKFAVVNGPLSPDHIVYAKSFPFVGEPTRPNIEAFRQKHGYAPMIVVTSVGVFGVGASQKKAELALELSQDAALVAQLTAAFGGVQFMTDRAREFIEHWEVESYRAKQMA
jgi:rhamnose utilization protein RhaD (predicted bifunctional aldolase and dehydrogenase)